MRPIGFAVLLSLVTLCAVNSGPHVQSGDVDHEDTDRQGTTHPTLHDIHLAVDFNRPGVFETFGEPDDISSHEPGKGEVIRNYTWYGGDFEIATLQEGGEEVILVVLSSMAGGTTEAGLAVGDPVGRIAELYPVQTKGTHGVVFCKHSDGSLLVIHTDNGETITALQLLSEWVWGGGELPRIAPKLPVTPDAYASGAPAS